MKRLIGIEIGIGFIFVFMNSIWAITAEPQATAVIDWTQNTGKVNRAIFSTQGFMQVYVEPDPMVMETFKLLNPEETQTRLEIYIHRMEPENDNDDPNLLNWSKLYPDKMIRFVDDRRPFDDLLDELGMERLALLCYMVPWLDSGNPKDPIKDKDEWVEYAAAVVETYNSSGENYRPNLRYVEVWNEPNMEMFYTGTMESYFELFNKTADRIHRDYPGVMVGGPALTHAYHCEPEKWMKEFMVQSAPKADYISYHHYGPQGEPVSVLTDDIKRWVNEFRKIPGKEQGKVMLTELDSWFHGWPKAQFILERQFRFLDLSDLILGIHHFCCLAYNESGNYTFGIVDQQGGVLGGTFWPYWLFRNLIGEQAYTLRNDPGQNRFDLAASQDTRNGQWIGTAVFHNRTQDDLPIKTLLYFPAFDQDRVLAMNRITADFKGIEKVIPIPAGTDHFPLVLTLAPEEGLALNLQESGKRLYPFRDLNCQETPWIGLTSSKTQIEFMENCDLEVRILNTNYKPVSGKIEIRGLPKGWSTELVSGKDQVQSLPLGETHLCRFQFQASSLVDQQKVAPYAMLLPEKNCQEAHSIPHSISVVSPIEVQVLPLPVFAIRGEENQVTLQISNKSSGQLEGAFEFTPPPGCKVGHFDEKFSIPPENRKRYQFSFQVGPDAKRKIQGKITLHYLGTEFEQNFTVEVGDQKAASSAIPLDILPWVNIDAAAYFSNRADYTGDHIGLFVYPADFTPSDRIVKIRGIPYRMASLEDGKKNAILPQGQTLEIPGGKYQGVAFMGYGHDGRHPGQWIFHYTDGTSEEVDSQIPEWCTPPPDGFEVAFTAPYRYIPGGPALPPCELFTWTLETNSTKTLESIELPKMEHAYLYAITLLPE